MLCEASAKEVPELEEPVCFELEAKTDKMKKLWNEVQDPLNRSVLVVICLYVSLSVCLFESPLVSATVCMLQFVSLFVCFLDAVTLPPLLCCTLILMSDPTRIGTNALK